MNVENAHWGQEKQAHFMQQPRCTNQTSVGICTTMNSANEWLLIHFRSDSDCRSAFVLRMSEISCWTKELLKDLGKIKVEVVHWVRGREHPTLFGMWHVRDTQGIIHLLHSFHKSVLFEALTRRCLLSLSSHSVGCHTGNEQVNT